MRVSRRRPRVWQGSRKYMMNILPGYSQEYGDLGGTETAGMTLRGDYFVVHEKTRDVVALAVAHLRRVVGEVGEPIFTSDMGRTPEIPEGYAFVAAMMHPNLLPPSLSGDPAYRRCAELVAEIFSKNGFTLWAWKEG